MYILRLPISNPLGVTNQPKCRALLLSQPLFSVLSLYNVRKQPKKAPQSNYYAYLNPVTKYYLASSRFVYENVYEIMLLFSRLSTCERIWGMPFIVLTRGRPCKGLPNVRTFSVLALWCLAPLERRLSHTHTPTHTHTHTISVRFCP